jgi:predicted metal-dependent phosphotriesterase family hydrolase
MNFRWHARTKLVLPGWTRREVLGLLGMGVAAAALPEFASAATPTFPKGAVIRTILQDYAPEDLAGAATLFHEHLSLADNFMTRWYGYGGLGPAGGAAPIAPAGPFFMQDLDLMASEMAIAKSEGIGCIVDAGHSDMGRDINFLRQLSTKSGMPIVAGGGFYAQPFYPKKSPR